MRISVVIGKNFGDEGKGLVTASLSLSCKKPLIIKSNGGAQAGHTVENPGQSTRFVHHQTGSGSEYGAFTLWAETYHPDLFKLDSEIDEFKNIFGFVPKLYSEPGATVTTIDDVLINMALENSRGDNRHGSCGMGINECCLRNAAGYGLTVGEISVLSPEAMMDRLKEIRAAYSLKRISELGLDMNDWHLALLKDENVLTNYVEGVKENLKYVELTEADNAFLEAFDGLIFENGQGLLLDEDNERFAPHVTASKTGLTNPMLFLNKHGLVPDEVLYVTRPYVTRHGAGFLPCECDRAELPGVGTDATNVTNEWQGSIRYARHESPEEFIRPIKEDLRAAGCLLKPSLVITHMDETDGNVLFETGALRPGEFEKVYTSNNRENFGLLYPVP